MIFARALPGAVVLALVTVLTAGGTAAAAPVTRVVHTRTTADADAVLRDAGVVPLATYGTVGAFAARLDAAQLRAVRAHPGVLGVEPDGPGPPREPRALPLARAVGERDNWGLDRIDQRALPLDGRHRTRATGAGVTIYVLDTGVDTAHPEFEGRARTAFDAVDGLGPAAGTAVEGDAAGAGDCDGHGTVVAGIAASRLHGVAPGAQVRSVRVLDCHGVGTLTSLLAGIDWVTRNAQRPAVVVMAWSYGPSDTLAAAVRGLVDGGVVVAASAGNSGADDCRALPRAVPGVLVVASATRDDRRAVTSSTGPCVDVYAPGASIVSTTPGGGTAAWSGTSMAAPHAAGVAALYLQDHATAAPDAVQRWIVDHATPGVVAGGGVDGTPNRLLYAGDL